jgi:hypothetical protein
MQPAALRDRRGRLSYDSCCLSTVLPLPFRRTDGMPGLWTV